MEKKFIKLNDSYSHLSLGNIINTIKDESKNKNASIQSEVFCVLFNIDYINESTVNNYCIGARSIGNDYKQIYINFKKKYQADNLFFKDIIKNILSLVEGTIYDIDNLKEINQNPYLINIVNKLYNIAKNDFFVPNEFTRKIKLFIDNNDYYNALINLLIYAILEKKQPLYEDNKVKNVVETILQNTNISVKELQDFLLLELNEGINFSYATQNLANKNNSFANYQLGIEYYRGDIDGTPDYIKAYHYFEKSALNNHPSAYWMMANIILENKIENTTEKDKEKALELLQKSMSLGNIAAINTIGLCYLNAWGIKKDLNKAILYFEKSAAHNYAYAYNNLGKIYEDSDKEKAFNYYLKSANLNESYACNKVGLYYLENLDYENAFKYFNQGTKTTLRATCLWNYYNLAKYFYLNGNHHCNISKDINKAIKYFELSSKLIESLIELLNIYISQNNKNKVLELINKIENHKYYHDSHKKIIEENIKKIKTQLNITIN